MAKEFESVRSMIETLKPSYPVYCLRPEIITQAATRFLEQFPGRVLYAVKCNPHAEVLRALHRAGIRHFDTASLPEIAQVRESFPDAACYFMHPVKGRAVINTAAKVYEIDTYIIDHPSELNKILAETGGAEGLTIYVRLKTPPVDGAFYHLAAKFGADVDDAHAVAALGDGAEVAHHVAVVAQPIVGADLVAKAVPDGHTILTASVTFVISSALQKGLPYDGFRDFAPITLLIAAPLGVLVHPSVPAKTMPELIAHAKGQPGRINYGSSGPGSIAHLSTEVIRHSYQVAS